MPPSLLSRERLRSTAIGLAILAAFIASAAKANATLYFHIDSAINAPDANPGDGICADATGKCNFEAANQELMTTWQPTCEGEDEEWSFAEDLSPLELGPLGSITSYGCGRTVRFHGNGRDRLTIRGVFVGAYFSTSSVDLDNLTIAGATVGVENAGAHTGLNASVSLTNVAVRNNEIGIRAAFRAVTGLTDTDVYDNSVIGIQNGTDEGGAPLVLGLTGSRVFNNGKGIANHSIIGLALVRSEISHNHGDGVRTSLFAASDNIPGLRIEDTAISDNDGVGLSITVAGSSTIQRSTIAGNRAGGVLIQRIQPDDGPTVRFENVTISGNSSDGSGGGVLLTSGKAALIGATITGNTADADGNGDGDGGGIYGNVNLEQSILAGNVDGGGEAPDCAGTIESADHNLFGSLVGCTIAGVPGSHPADLVGVAPLLGPLQDNGGPTPTHALLAGSPAIDAGGTFDATTIDQRSVHRPQFSAADIGAFEFACGNGTVDLGETCDDGNTSDGDCCSANCQPEPNGSPCADGNACTTEACDGAGSCAPGSPVDCGPCQTCDSNAGCIASVLSGCHQPTERFSGQLQILNTTKPKLKWQWINGQATDLADFGDPFVGDRYSLCLFDESGPTPQLAFRAATRAGLCNGTPCWRTAGASSFKYKDREQAPDGLDTLLLKSGGDGKAKVLATGRGSELPLPVLPLGLPARMQLQAENGQCWEARYFEVGTSRNNEQEFKAKAYKP